MTGPVGGRVLVVDDHPDAVKLMETRLRASGYEVLKAYSGQEAIKLVREHMPDVVLLDIMMPGMNGYEVTEHIKQDPGRQLFPLCLLPPLMAPRTR